MKFNIKILVRLALFAAISIILGKFLQIPIGDSIRISFENLALILAGYLYGPVAGALCGAAADILGCIFKGYSINPIITLAATIIGFCAGVFGKCGFFKKPKLLLSVYSAHILGSMILKSVGLYIYFATPPAVLAWRIPLYIAIGALEYMLIRFCLNHKGLKELL